MSRHDLVEAADVGLVERSVHLVEQTERRRADQEQREHERRRRERLLAAESRLSDWSFLPAGCTTISTPASPPSSLGTSSRPRLAAREHLREHLGELLVRRREGLVEALARGARELRDRLPQVFERALEIVALLAQELVALPDLVVARPSRPG